MRYLTSACALALLAACGGGGGGSEPLVDDTIYVSLLDGESTETSALRSFGVEGTGGSETLERETDRITVGGLAGDLSEDRLSVSLDEGGVVTLHFDGTVYVARFDAEPLTEDPFYGVIGQQTHRASVPASGSASYSGADNVRLEIVDGGDFYDALGSGTFLVDFAGDRVSLTISEVDGTRTSGLEEEAVAGILVIEIEDAVLSGATFSGGDASFSASTLENALSGAEMTDLSGALFGPDAAEIGGVLTIDDTSSGAVRVRAVYVGN